MKSRGQNEVAAQINSWRARCHERICHKIHEDASLAAGPFLIALTDFVVIKLYFDRFRCMTYHFELVVIIFHGWADQ